VLDSDKMMPTKELDKYSVPKRLQGVAPTLIRQIFERALPDSINFGLGEPDVRTPMFICEEAARVTLEEQNGYTSHPGLQALRQAVADSYKGLSLKFTDVCITAGSQEAMTDAFLALVDDGDEVLIPNPGFPAYDNCVMLCGGVPVHYRMPAEKDFAFDLEEFKSKLTPKTKVVVVISPSNPTGRVMTETDLRGIAAALEGTGIYIISDEIYADLYFTEQPPWSVSEFYDRTVIVSGLSKGMSMTGWRVGWVASRQSDVVNAVQVVHGFVSVCTSTISQKASLLAFTEEGDRAKAEIREIYRKRGQLLVGLLKDELGLHATVPEGAFYTMVDVRKYGTDIEVAEKFLRNRVITVPGVAFGDEAKGFLRISFCNNDERMIEGVRRMREALGV